ncbi:hypothetical protein PWG15_08515 [Ensifer adhaerens]|uniref:hypothetical protein n=1 Tax=Ensifer adhaerens TaxID=106592 RepID=UPI0023A92203|nr:hypothetical protein [Ensifer adhaerens]WDZ78512.1 hypothetical protein PWG15_08515 [Ensifer adhaerens]
MLEHWAVMWTTLQCQHRRGPCKSFDDPLDGPEWRGLHWVLPILSFLLLRRRRRQVRLTRAPAAPVAGALWGISASRCGPKAAGHDR